MALILLMGPRQQVKKHVMLRDEGKPQLSKEKGDSGHPRQKEHADKGTDMWARSEGFSGNGGFSASLKLEVCRSGDLMGEDDHGGEDLSHISVKHLLKVMTAIGRALGSDWILGV